MAPSLTATAKKLERNLVQNQVSHLLETRPEKDELVTHHILDGTNAYRVYCSRSLATNQANAFVLKTRTAASRRCSKARSTSSSGS